MSFKKLQENLRAEGWAVEWNMPCCQSCAWAEIEADDLSKVLFNHSQDCEVDYEEGEECAMCDGEGWNEEADDDCDNCSGRGTTYDNINEAEYDTSVSGFVCMTPEQAGGSLFCFDGDKKGVQNLKSILPLIKESGCSYEWDETGKSRIYISW